MNSTILVVDDDPVQRRLLGAAVERMGYVLQTADSGEAALEQLANPTVPHPDAMILDLIMPGIDGLGVMAELNARQLDLPVIVQTAQGGVDVAVSAMRAGAFDFCVKPASADRLAKTIADALKVEQNQTKLQKRQKRAKTEPAAKHFVGASDSVKRVLGLVAKAAASDIPVLIEGESGTGKELIARSVQAQSDRAAKPFVIVNCGAIPENLVESILFGHEKGAFTGATEKHTGKFVEADGGTLFLDEIGDLPLEAQVKLLRAIQDGEVEPVGARTSRKVNVRLVSATNRDLIAAVREGTFREDLYYRLNVFPIMVPPLRYRKEDIAALADHFIKSIADENNFSARALSKGALDLLSAHDWPGNVRQLQNAIFRAVVLCEDDALQPYHFPQIGAQVHGITIAEAPSMAPDYNEDRRTIAKDAAVALNEVPADNPDMLSLITDDGHARSLTNLEAETIAKAITRYQGRMSEVARRLGIGRSTLYRKLKEHDIEPAELCS